MKLKMILALAMVSMVVACAEVKPWERDLLADKYMALVPSALDNSLDNHIYFSKEAASGGQGVGGGGCGCN
ncbi:MAG: DUF4266 domain-containing protein [Gammaproteobacteria bacterium]|nr:DUF4266 domain-containing protein [Gammaproteobacteria bacterium]